MNWLGVRRLFAFRRAPPLAYRASFPTRAYDYRNLGWAQGLRLRLPRLLLDVACVFCLFMMVTVSVLNLPPPYARVFGIGKISSWRLHHDSTISPTHRQHSDYVYTLYPSGLCVQSLSIVPLPMHSERSVPGKSLWKLTARAIDHDWNHRFSSQAHCIPPVIYNSTSWTYRIPQPYSIDDCAPTESILRQRPYSMVGPVDTYPAFVCYVLTFIFGVEPTLFLLWRRRSHSWQRLYERSMRHRDDDLLSVADFDDDDDDDDGDELDVSGRMVVANKSRTLRRRGPKTHAYTTLCALVAMTTMIVASVNITLLRDSLAWSLERGAADVDGVWKEDVGLAFSWSAAGCMILVALGMLARALLVLLARAGWVPRRWIALL